MVIRLPRRRGWSICVFPSAVGEGFNGTEKNRQWEMRPTSSGPDHNARNWGPERESTKVVHQRVFVFCVKNTWTRSSSFYAHCSAGHASTVAVLHIHTDTHNGSIVVVLFLNVLIPFLFKPFHLVTRPSIYLHWLFSVSEWVQRLYLHWEMNTHFHSTRQELPETFGGVRWKVACSQDIFSSEDRTHKLFAPFNFVMSRYRLLPCQKMKICIKLCWILGAWNYHFDTFSNS